MQLAVISDIHSNYRALESCLAEAKRRKIDHYLFLGDYTTDCAYPQKTMDILYALQADKSCWFIRGNREEYLLRHRQGFQDGWKVPSTTTGNLLYTYENLRTKDLDFFESLDIKQTVEIEGYPALLCCHGSPTDSRGDLSFGSEGARRALETYEEEIIVCGHTHHQGVFVHNGKKLANAGSVGVPVDWDGRTQFLVLHSQGGEWQEEFIRLEYDREGTIRDLYESGLAEKCNIWAKTVEDTLRTGVDKTILCLELAQRLFKQQTAAGGGNGCGEEELEEVCWREAARQLGICS